ncbi:hypothetical protein ACWCYY_04490 [Kitasatospora sp. NPDC001664]
MQRLGTFGAVELTADPARFGAGLSSWRDPSFMGRLGHVVSGAAPGGSVEGVATVARSAVAPVAPVAPVVRQGRAEGVPSRVPLRGSGGAEAAPLTVARVVELPVLRLPARGPVDGPEPEAVAPLVGEVELVAPPVVPEPAVAERALGLGAPTGGPVPVRMPTAVQRVAGGRPRRRLGAPLRELPPTAARQVDVVRPLEVQRELGPEPVVGAEVRESVRPEPSVPLVHGPWPLQRLTTPGPLLRGAVEDGVPEAVVGGTVAGLVGDRAGELWVLPALPSGVPSVGGVPEAVPVRWGGTGGDGASAGGRRGADGSVSVTEAVVQRRGSAGGAGVRRAAAGRPGARSTAGEGGGGDGLMTDPGTVAVAAGIARRMADGSVVFEPPAPLSGGQPLSAVPLRPALGSIWSGESPVPPLPSVSRSVGQRAGRSVHGAAWLSVPVRTVADGAGRPVRSGALMPSSRPPLSRLPEPLQGAGPLVSAQRQYDPPPERVAAAPPQPPPPEPVVEAAPEAAAAVRSETAPPQSAAPSPGAGPPQAESTDELVRRLIDPLSRRLRAELRLDQERAGLRRDDRRY